MSKDYLTAEEKAQLESISQNAEKLTADAEKIRLNQAGIAKGKQRRFDILYGAAEKRRAALTQAELTTANILQKSLGKIKISIELQGIEDEQPNSFEIDLLDNTEAYSATVQHLVNNFMQVAKAQVNAEMTTLRMDNQQEFSQYKS